MSTATPTIDLNAAKREAKNPEGITVLLGDQTFLLPAELPADVFDPLLSDDLDLVGIFKDLAADDKPAEPGQPKPKRDFGDDVIDLLTKRPTLPRAAVQAVKDCFALLFGEDQYVLFVAQRPSFNDYLRLGKGLLEQYGVGLGEALASPDSSESGGATSSPTSPSTPESTPAALGFAQVPPTT